MPKITTNHANTYTNLGRTRRIYLDLGGDRKGQDHDAYQPAANHSMKFSIS